MRRVHLIVHGRVQGVFFRRNTKKIADKLNLKGWVRNNPDNSVEIIAEGSDEAVNKLLNWCRKGPIGAKVEKVALNKEKYKNEFKDFSIVY